MISPEFDDTREVSVDPLRGVSAISARYEEYAFVFYGINNLAIVRGFDYVCLSVSKNLQGIRRTKPQECQTKLGEHHATVVTLETVFRAMEQVLQVYLRERLRKTADETSEVRIEASLYAKTQTLLEFLTDTDFMPIQGPLLELLESIPRA